MAITVNARNKQKHENKKLRERERKGKKERAHFHVFLATKNRISAITALQIRRSNFQRRRVS